MKFFVTIICKLCMLGTIFISFSACNGILGNLYDDPIEEDKREFGFIETNETTHSGTIHIDATDYGRWTYIDFHSLSIDSVNISPDMQEPENWDVAIHRYDAKTNGGAVLETGFTGLSTLQTSGKMPEGEYVPDEWTTNKIIIDMSGMMEGTLKYAESYYNRELSKWLFVDTGTMPPGYHPSNKVYVVRLKDNTLCALRLRNFMNAKNVKGFMTIDYIYPFEV